MINLYKLLFAFSIDKTNWKLIKILENLMLIRNSKVTSKAVGSNPRKLCRGGNFFINFCIFFKNSRINIYTKKTSLPYAPHLHSILKSSTSLKHKVLHVCNNGNIDIA